MLHSLQVFLLAVCFLGGSKAALPQCPKPGCPDGGIWSDWSTKETCSANCGSCSRLFYTRTCLSASADCPCNGDTSRYLLCNTQACVYPAQRTCCIPYNSMIINGTMQCGPLPRFTETTKSCCPPNGLWAEWSGYTRTDAGVWRRTRKCVSENADCPCVGETSMTTSSCPCRAMQNVAEAVRDNYYVYPNNYTIDQVACTYTGWLLYVSNGSDAPCKPNGALVRIQSSLGVRQDYWTFKCDSPGLAGNNKITFYCDPVSLYWTTYYSNVAVNGWTQINIQTPTGK